MEWIMIMFAVGQMVKQNGGQDLNLLTTIKIIFREIFLWWRSYKFFTIGNHVDGRIT